MLHKVVLKSYKEFKKCNNTSVHCIPFAQIKLLSITVSVIANTLYNDRDNV